MREFGRPYSLLMRAALVIGAPLLLQSGTVSSSAGADRLAGVKSWGYQLQRVDPQAIADSPYDLVVIDYSRDGSAAGAFSHDEVALMQQRPDGGRRLVLAYLSIGEAEDYRFYWQSGWSLAPPNWLGPENPEWEGNYAIAYWEPAWQALIFGGADAYLGRIIDAGFDGVYLDRIDAFDRLDPAMRRPQRMAAMSGFVVALADYARARVPGFVVIGQNGEELLADPAYAGVIDGLGKEDLLYGVDGDGVANERSLVRASLDLIEPFQAGGKPMFLIEYLTDPAAIEAVRAAAQDLNAPLFIGGRALDDVQSR